MFKYLSFQRNSNLNKFLSSDRTDLCDIDANRAGILKLL